eukprot:TRINITY_DN1123_c0_g4_i1.p1 TRINITY_DN1123_c0_g4~~TRINITY_DN1123_c0_g4_i1.p1  ORF type:complete len:175 (-),score=43.41 TRINITY_DN1123_c0_g4_i1:2-526(-)
MSEHPFFASLLPSPIPNNQKMPTTITLILLLLLTTLQCVQTTPTTESELMFHEQTESLHIQTLNGNDWTLTNHNGNISIPSTVPGVQYEDLMRAKVIGDPYFRYNEREYEWIAHQTWVWTKTFTLSKEIQSFDRFLLVLHGVDTFATVMVDNQPVVSTNNQFVKYQYFKPPSCC